MVKITVKDFTNDELEKRWNALANKDNWEEECEWCKMPGMLHKGPCTRKEETNAFEYQKIYEGWNLYRNRMKLIIELKQKQEEKDDSAGMEKFATLVAGAFTMAQKPLIEAVLGRENRTAKIIKPARPPAWTKNMTLEVYLKALEVWMEQNKDISEHVKYNDVIETLKQN